MDALIIILFCGIPVKLFYILLKSASFRKRFSIVFVVWASFELSDKLTLLKPHRSVRRKTSLEEKKRKKKIKT